jgi:hypothetical protein
MVAFLQETSMTSIEGSNYADATALFGLYEEACLYAEGLLFEVQDVARLASVKVAHVSEGSWIFDNNRRCVTGWSFHRSFDRTTRSCMCSQENDAAPISEYVREVMVLPSDSHSVA